jgi:hypothetical protein
LEVFGEDAYKTSDNDMISSPYQFTEKAPLSVVLGAGIAQSV